MERAEDMTRILAVNFLAQLDAPAANTALAWHPLVAIAGSQENYRAHFDTYDARTVTEFFLWHPANPDAVRACIARARENARAVREQITVEMWEHLNRLYLSVQEADHKRILRNPDPFFRSVRDAAQAFQGITDATLTHGEAFEFIELGKYHERASQTIRILDVKFAAALTLPDGSPEATLQLIAMLKSCSAFEPFRRAHASQLQAWRVAEFLLLHREFPRAVAFCLQRCLRALQNLAPDTQRAPAPPGALRVIGRLAADLDYVDIHDVLRDDFHSYLIDLLARLDFAGDEITRTFFNTQVILTDPRQQQAQQQQ